MTPTGKPHLNSQLWSAWDLLRYKNECLEVSESCKNGTILCICRFLFQTFWWPLSRLAPGWCSLHHPPAVVGTEVAFQMNAHLAVQRGVDERIVASWAHGHQVTADLEDVDVPLADHVEVWVQVQQQVQNLHKNMEKPGSQLYLECFYIIYSLFCINILMWDDQEHSLMSVKLNPNLRTAVPKYQLLTIETLNSSEYTYFSQMHASQC